VPPAAAQDLGTIGQGAAIGTVFVHLVRLGEQVDALQTAGREATSAPRVAPVGALCERGGEGVTAIMELSRAVGEVSLAFGVNVGFTATAIGGAATNTAAADRGGPQ